VTPRFRFVASAAAGAFDIYDDPDFGVDAPPVTDEQSVKLGKSVNQVECPF